MKPDPVVTLMWLWTAFVIVVAAAALYIEWSGRFACVFE